MLISWTDFLFFFNWAKIAFCQAVARTEFAVDEEMSLTSCSQTMIQTEFICYEANVEDCEGWWLSACRGSVAEHWRLKPEVSWIRLPATAGPITSSIFASKHLNSFTSSVRQDALSMQWYKLPPATFSAWKCARDKNIVVSYSCHHNTYM